MNAFQAFGPDQRADGPPSFDVSLYRDGDHWIAQSDALSIATEATTLDALIDRVWEIAPEVAALNGHRGALMLRFVLDTAMPA